MPHKLRGGGKSDGNTGEDLDYNPKIASFIHNLWICEFVIYFVNQLTHFFVSLNSSINTVQFKKWSASDLCDGNIFLQNYNVYK
jgi:hypothetical protein